MSLSTHQQRLGFLAAAYQSETKSFSQNQIRYLDTIARQMIVTLENLRLLDDSQRRARREQIIREITSKIRGATDVNDILKTTVTEVSKLAGTSQGRIMLGPPSTAGGETAPGNSRDKNNGQTPARE
jgi:GAF domain-containing protein